MVRKLAVITILLVAATISWNVYTIHDTIIEGAAYGFNIGGSKKDTFDKIKNGDFHSVWLSYPRGSAPPLEAIPMGEFDNTKMLSADLWKVTIGSRSLLNNIRLTFKDGKLIEIYRHRQVLELP